MAERKLLKMLIVCQFGYYSCCFLFIVFFGHDQSASVIDEWKVIRDQLWREAISFFLIKLGQDCRRKPRYIEMN